MLRLLNSTLRRLCSTLSRSIRRRSKPPAVVIKRYAKTTDSQFQLGNPDCNANGSASAVHPGGSLAEVGRLDKGIIRVATFKTALFSMVPAVTKTEARRGDSDKSRCFSDRVRPRSILKPSRQKTSPKPKLRRVSINLPENEISLLRNAQSRPSWRPLAMSESNRDADEKLTSGKAVSEVLRELDVDILALQDVKADEENDMKPLSELAEALGMNYVFAESWAPQYGNAILSRWPIKRSNVQKLLDNSDFRNVLKATIDVPGAGDVNFYCTHLDHLDENRRMKQINAIIETNGDEPHLLAGGLNSLCGTDYSTERWTDISEFYQEIGKPRPKADVMRFMKSKHYIDARDFAGEFESVVIIAKGQSVQGTCKYGTRMDYLLASPNFPYEFVPGSYTVYSSQGTSDHHIVKVDLIKRKDTRSQSHQNTTSSGGCRRKVVRISDPSSSRGIWSMPNTKMADFSGR